jgi:hypothetical protein
MLIFGTVLGLSLSTAMIVVIRSDLLPIQRKR